MLTYLIFLEFYGIIIIVIANRLFSNPTNRTQKKENSMNNKNLVDGFFKLSEERNITDVIPLAKKLARELSEKEVNEAYASKSRLSPAASEAATLLYMAWLEINNPDLFGE